MTSQHLLRISRSFRKSAFPAFMFALALGGVLALFALYNAIAHRHTNGQERIVTLNMDLIYPDGHTDYTSPSPLELKEAESLQCLEGKPVQQEIKYLRVEAGGGSRSLLVAYASPEYFSTLGIPAVVGRTFSATDPEPGAVLSWSAWKHYAGALPIGAPIVVDGVSLPLLGVLPPDFNGFWPGYEPQVWITLEARARSGTQEVNSFADRNAGIPTFARLRQGVSPTQAEEALRPLVTAWQAQRTPLPIAVRARIRPVDELGKDAWRAFLPEATLLWVATGLLVIMATINVGSLQVASWMRDRDAWTTRVALGAPPSRLIAELCAPMLLSLVLGALGAIPIAWAQGNLITSFVPPSEYPTQFHLQMDWSVYFVAIAIIGSLAIPLIFMAWVWFLRHSSRLGTRGELGGVLWRKSLLGTQMALSVVLLCGTTNSLTDLWRAKTIRLGFDVQGIQAFSFGFPAHIQGGREAIRDEWTRIFNRFHSAPDCQASCVEIPPCEAYEPKPRAYRNSNGIVTNCLVSKVSSGTFNLLHIPILFGRDFTDSDTPEAPLVAIVSAPLAQAFWPTQSPLGQTLEDKDGRRFQVIGVVGDHLWEGPNKLHRPLLFLSVRQRSSNLQTLLIRSPLQQQKLYEWVEREVAMIDPRLTIQRAEPLSILVNRMFYSKFLAATLFGIMGATAITLSLLGLYALQDYLTIQRLREAGVKMALGATPEMVRLDFMRGMGWPMGIGLMAGIVGAVAGWHLLSSLVIGLSPLSLSSLGIVALGLLATSLLAAMLPLRRLSHSEPADLMRDTNT